MKTMFRVTLLTLLYSATAMAQSGSNASDTQTTEEEPPEYFQVELVIFRHLDQSTTTPEIPRPPEPETTELLEQDLARLGSGNLDANSDVTEEDSATTTDEDRWFSVDDQEHLLTSTVNRIDRLQAYELVTYLTWGQTAPDVTVAEPIDLSEIGGPDLLLEGTVELHQRRYLHLAIDVTLGDSSQPVMTSTTDGTFQFMGNPPALPAIKDSRRVRLEKLLYFDQPEFGVLAVVSRLEMPEGDLALTDGAT